MLVLTTFDEEEYLYEALRAGTSGFLLKVSPPEQLIGAVRTVAAGNALIDPAVTRRVIAAFGRRVATRPPPPTLQELTARELEVLQLMARGLSNQEIAAELIVGDATVKTHVARVLMKLGLRDRVQAVVFAYEHGIVEPGAVRLTRSRTCAPRSPHRPPACSRSAPATASWPRPCAPPATTSPRSTPRAATASLPVALLDLDAPPRTFDAAVAMVSLHHVVPLGHSLRRLSEVMRHGARLVIDEFDVDLLDERASAWWLDHAGKDKQPADHVAEMREHLYPVAQIRAELAPWFDLGEPVPCAYLYRWPHRPGAARRGGAADRRGRAPRGRLALRRDPALALRQAAGALARGRVLEAVVAVRRGLVVQRQLDVGVEARRLLELALGAVDAHVVAPDARPRERHEREALGERPGLDGGERRLVGLAVEVDLFELAELLAHGVEHVLPAPVRDVLDGDHGVVHYPRRRAHKSRRRNAHSAAAPTAAV